jgi:hypothetical protein
MENNSSKYDTLDEEFLQRVSGLVDDILLAINVSSEILKQDEELVLDFIVDYINVHNENL